MLSYSKIRLLLLNLRENKHDRRRSRIVDMSRIPLTAMKLVKSFEERQYRKVILIYALRTKIGILHAGQ